MRLPVLINHGGMAARRFLELRLLPVLLFQLADAAGKEVLDLTLGCARCENKDITATGIQISCKDGHEKRSKTKVAFT